MAEYKHCVLKSTASNGIALLLPLQNNSNQMTQGEVWVMQWINDGEVLSPPDHPLLIKKQVNFIWILRFIKHSSCATRTSFNKSPTASSAPVRSKPYRIYSIKPSVWWHPSIRQFTARKYHHLNSIIIIYFIVYYILIVYWIRRKHIQHIKNEKYNWKKLK